MLQVMVTPRSARDEIIGWRGEELRIRLREAPSDGRANQALRRYLAELLDLSIADVEIASGAAARHKRVSLQGISQAEMVERLKPGHGSALR